MGSAQSLVSFDTPPPICLQELGGFCVQDTVAMVGLVKWLSG